jgi:two-component system NtrC family sensor kinase
MIIQGIRRWLSVIPRELRDFTAYGESPERYRRLRRNMILLGLLGTLVPLLLMAIVNHHQYQKALKGEVVQPLRALVNKTKHSFDLFLAERRSAVSFVASAYSYKELSDEKTLNRVFQVMRREFGGFVDLGLIDSSGIQVSYVGPYALKGKDYSDQAWFHEVRIRGTYISDVFMGHRELPHFVIAVEHHAESGECCYLRATIDTDKFNSLIASVALDPATDAFVVNHLGILQTPSKFYGRVLDMCPLPLPPRSHEPNALEEVDHRGREILLGYIYSDSLDFVLFVVKPRAEILKAWYTLKSELFILFVVSVIAISLVVFRLTDLLVKRIQEADERREAAHREAQYTSKLASIGRLAAGVAHEINNPMAIINEQAGLMKDIIEYGQPFPEKEKFLSLTESVLHSVDRVRNITHRLLGFARRMDVKFETLDLNDLIREVLSFLEKEAFHRRIGVRLQLAEDLPKISSDWGQLQQVFLNILNNAFEAVEDGGEVTIANWESGPDAVAVSILDNGKGMPDETMRHIFEPFFTTKVGYGTGLGLSITYGIVKRLGGDIEVRSRVGEGTTFTVVLPKVATQARGA